MRATVVTTLFIGAAGVLTGHCHWVVRVRRDFMVVRVKGNGEWLNDRTKSRTVNEWKSEQLKRARACMLA